MQDTVCPKCGRALFLNELLPKSSHHRQLVAFQGAVLAIGIPIFLLAMAVVVIAANTSLSDRRYRLLALPAIVAFVMMSSLMRGKSAYSEGRWPEFAETAGKSFLLVTGIAIACAALLWWLSSFY